MFCRYIIDGQSLGDLMTKEAAHDSEVVDVKQKQPDKKKITLEMDLPDSGDLIVCEVCGHKNPKDVAMCTMCSNYLF